MLMYYCTVGVCYGLVVSQAVDASGKTKHTHFWLHPSLLTLTHSRACVCVCNALPQDDRSKSLCFSMYYISSTHSSNSSYESGPTHYERVMINFQVYMQAPNQEDISAELTKSPSPPLLFPKATPSIVPVIPLLRATWKASLQPGTNDRRSRGFTYYGASPDIVDPRRT